MQSIAAVVVTFNRKDLLRESILSIINQSASCDVLIIDNASTDGTGEFIKDLVNSENVFYYNTGSNLGGAGGFSYGIKLACEIGYEYIWLMDDDTVPESNALEEFIKAKQLVNDDFGFLSSAVYWTDGAYCNMNIPVVDRSWHEKSRMLEQGMIRIQSASFVSMFIKASVIKDAGLPIKQFFIWYDDQEYSSRLAKKHNSYFVSQSIVIHKMKSNIKVSIAEDSAERISRYKMAYRNNYYIARRDGLKAKAHYYIRCVRDIKNIIKSGSSMKIKRIKCIIFGTINGWFFKPSIEHLK